VIAFLQGQLGTPEAGFLQPFTDQVLAGRPRYTDPVLDQAQIDALADPARQRSALTRLMLPAEAAACERLRATHGDVSVIPTRPFLFGLEPGHVETLVLAPGQQVFVELEAIGDLDDTGRRSVHLRANGQPIAFRVIDQKAPLSAVTRAKAEPGNPAHLAATVPGVIHVHVNPGDEIQPGQRVAVIEAMKMEAPITSTSAGIIATLHLNTGAQVDPGDLIATLTLIDR
jgi:pyruvate carboxylase